MNAIYSRHGFESWGSIISTSRVNTMDASHSLCMHGAGLAPQSQCWMVHRQTLVCTCTCVLWMQLLSMCPKTFDTFWGAPAFTTSPNCCSMHGTQQTIILDGASPVCWVATEIIQCKLQCCWRSSGSGSTTGVPRMRKHKLASIMVHDCRDAHVYGQIV